MSLTVGAGPFGQTPKGRFNVDVPREGLIYSEPSPRRIRALRGGETVVDSRRAQLIFESGRLPRYFFPPEDVRPDLPAGVAAEDAPSGAGLEGHVAFAWDAMDAWLEEDDEIIGHAPDPYHRIDVRSTSRHVRVSLDGHLLAESARTVVLFETSLAPRWYLPREDVVVELEPSELVTTCAYKGHARYWSARLGDELAENLVWSYPDPRVEAAPIAGRLAFFNERVDLDVDGERQPRPAGPWSQPGWWRAHG
jgi:uncharacterized protein (DUF427 family)